MASQRNRENLSPEEREALRKAGGLDALMETLKTLGRTRKRHQGGNKWVGTGGTSPFGAYGDNPEGVRIGQKAIESSLRLRCGISASLKT